MDSIAKNKLILAGLIDALGAAPLILEILGMPFTAGSSLLFESLDFFWAPISMILILIIFRQWLPAILNLFEEWFPGSDIVPSALIAWAIWYKKHLKLAQE